MLSKNCSIKTELTQKDKDELLEKLQKKVGISLQNIIGKGGMGEIYEAKFGKYTIAIKIIYKKVYQDIDEFLRDCRRESYFSTLSLHENVIKTIGSNIIKVGENALYYIAMEKAINRDLNVLIQSQGSLQFYESFISLKGFNDSFCRFFFLQFCKGYLCLYQSKVTHLDIKPENLLLSKDFVVKVADFSLCHYIQKDEKSYKPPTASISYMPPETYNKEELPVDQLYKVDLYAFGVVLYFMKFKERFIQSKKTGKEYNTQEIIEKIKENKKKFAEEKDISEDCKEFFKKTMELDYKERINISEFLQHDWIHKNSEIIKYTVKINEGEQRKFCLELQKLDYYINKEKLNTNNNDEPKKKVQINKFCLHQKKYKLTYKKKRNSN